LSKVVVPRRMESLSFITLNGELIFAWTKHFILTVHSNKWSDSTSSQEKHKTHLFTSKEKISCFISWPAKCLLLNMANASERLRSCMYNSFNVMMQQLDPLGIYYIV
jgi:hypothetical protein